LTASERGQLVGRVRTQGKRDIRRLDPAVKQRVIAAIERVAADPPAADLRRLSGRGESRLRVGDWRVIVALDVRAHRIVVCRVLPRGRAYER
jgi:mRNA interferase RelE/StbE